MEIQLISIVEICQKPPLFGAPDSTNFFLFFVRTLNFWYIRLLGERGDTNCTNFHEWDHG